MTPQRAYVHLSDHSVTASPTGTAAPTLVAVLRNKLILDVLFVDSAGAVESLANGTLGKLVFKKPANQDGDALSLDTAWAPMDSSDEDDAPLMYRFESVIDSDYLRTYLGTERSRRIVAAIEWGVDNTTPDFDVVVNNTSARGTETAPNPVADSAWDWLKAALVASTNVTFTDNNTTKTRAIAASGGSTVDAAAVAAIIHAGTDKSDLADDDEIGISNSAASWGWAKVKWSVIKNALQSYFGGIYAAVVHGHEVSEVNGLAGALSDKADGLALQSHIDNASNAHGIGTIISDLAGKLDADGDGSALTSLNASQLASGTVPTARLGSGTANGGSFLRGDNTWQAIATAQTAEERALEATRPQQIQLLWTGTGQSSTNTGSGSTTQAGHNVVISSGTTANSRAQYWWPNNSADILLNVPGGYPGSLDWSKPVTVGFALSLVSTSAASIFCVRIGSNFATTGNLSGAGIGIKLSNLTLIAQTHNGSTRTDSSTLLTAATSQQINVQMRSDGAGNVKVWVNSTLVATLTGGPTATSSSFGVAGEATNNADASACRVHLGRVFIRVDA